MLVIKNFETSSSKKLANNLFKHSCLRACKLNFVHNFTHFVFHHAVWLWRFLFTKIFHTFDWFVKFCEQISAFLSLNDVKLLEQLSLYTVDLKVLSSEMDLAECQKTPTSQTFWFDCCPKSLFGDVTTRYQARIFRSILRPWRLWCYDIRGRILGRNWDKSLKSFLLAIHSHLY